MKKYLLLGLLGAFMTVPVLADPESNPIPVEPSIDVSGFYKANGGTVTNACAGDVFANATSENPVNMVANFAPACASGYYLKVDDTVPDAGIQYATVGDKYVYCATCDAGYSCDGFSTTDIETFITNNSGVLKSMGKDRCPVGTWTGAGANTCTPCAVGTYNSNEGSSSIDACLSCAVDTYADETGLAACKSCPPDWPTTGDATGSTTINSCYKECSGTPTCVPHADNTCSFVDNGIAMYGSYCKTTFAGCEPGYDKTAIATAITSANIDTVISSGTTWTISLINAPLSSIQGVYRCVQNANATSWGCYAKPTTLVDGATQVGVDGAEVLLLDFNSESACNAGCNGSGAYFEDDTYWNTSTNIALINGSTDYLCVAKTVNIDWEGATPGTCTFGGDLVTPDTAPEKPDWCTTTTGGNDCSFLGWKVQTTTSNQGE